MKLISILLHWRIAALFFAVFLVALRGAASIAYHSEAPLEPASVVRAYTIRLTPGQDLRKELLEFANRHQLQAPGIITCVGSLTDVSVRLANQTDGTTRKGHFEIVSLVGMIDPPGGHLHLCVTDEKGVAFGGHLLDGSLVYTTAEIVVGELTELKFDREVDPTFGYKELVIKRRTTQ